MSNSLAIATVTGALATRVQGLLNGAGLSGLQVVAGHPKTSSASGVYITLYHLSANSALRNLDLPTRGPDGTTRQRPVLALTLRYLFSFIGDPDVFESERLAGLVLADLHARPVIGPDEISAFLETLASNHALRASDLVNQPERVKLTPVNLDTEELSRVWGLFNQGVFALSMAWDATAVLLDGTTEPSIGLPVAQVGLAVRPSVAPRLARVYEESSRQPVVEATQTIRIEGGGLLGQTTHVVIGPARRAVGAADMVDGTLRVPLGSVSGLRPGVQTVVVEHTVEIPGAAGDGLRPAGSSNALALMVLPALGAASYSTAGPAPEVRIAVTPLPAVDQNVELFLEAGNERRSSRTFAIDGSEVVFPVPAIPAGSWRIRLVVDGAANRPSMTDGVYSGPTLTVP